MHVGSCRLLCVFSCFRAHRPRGLRALQNPPRVVVEMMQGVVELSFVHISPPASEIGSASVFVL